jgi:hypothetical protein
MKSKDQVCPLQSRSGRGSAASAGEESSILKPRNHITNFIRGEEHLRERPSAVILVAISTNSPDKPNIAILAAEGARYGIDGGDNRGKVYLQQSWRGPSRTESLTRSMRNHFRKSGSLT